MPQVDLKQKANAQLSTATLPTTPSPATLQSFHQQPLPSLPSHQSPRPLPAVQRMLASPRVEFFDCQSVRCAARRQLPGIGGTVQFLTCVNPHASKAGLEPAPERLGTLVSSQSHEGFGNGEDRCSGGIPDDRHGQRPRRRRRDGRRRIEIGGPSRRRSGNLRVSEPSRFVLFTGTRWRTRWNQ